MRNFIAAVIVIVVMTALTAPLVVFADYIREFSRGREWMAVYVSGVGMVVSLGLFILVGYYFWVTPP